MKIVLIGYYGFHNLGDDLMLQGILNALEGVEVISNVYVLVKDHYYKAQSAKVRFIKIHGLLSKLRLVYCIAISRFIMWGGGTCLYESRSGDNAGLRFLCRLETIAKWLRSRFVFWGIGIGSVYTQKGKKLTCKILNMAHRVNFREEESLRAAIALAGNNAKFDVGGDLFFLNAFSPRSKRITRPAKISFSGIYSYKDDNAIVRCYAGILDKLAHDLSARIYFIPFHQGEKNDNEFHRAIARNMKNINYEIFEYDEPLLCLNKMEAMDFHIGMRLHSIIAADCLRVPSIAINYSPKVRFYVEQSALSRIGRISEIGMPIVPDTVCKIMAAHKYDDSFIARQKKRALQGLYSILS
jgi:polysaccharide pyruvyl transferase WcaK-like protein